MGKYESFSSFHPEAHLPLSVIGGGSVYLQLSLQDPPAPHLLLLVHSCLAFTHTPHSSWRLVYDGCRGDSQLLPSSRSTPPPTQRILIPALQSPPSESPPLLTEGGSSHLQDPEIYFMCLTEVCYAADVDCTISCIHSKFNTQDTPKRN
ncbi:zona pellucida sperm-binding protein 1-like [Notothenia coriiceps]|uniref:Zona pellucida sperm-binding protein 1-like n=1 Tax=Notothenia coriiceps TaxID=8208 RepID=A0A6I9N3P3_9TELE|nr:PREDICTED: zona pellucida sperm-binding protein 1-like [Notothenia coriiceps]